MINLKKKQKFNQNQIFTFHKEIANCESMDQIRLIIERNNHGLSDDALGFDFFMIKIFRIEKKVIDNLDEPEFAVEFIDFSQKILYDSLNTERKYLSYINATVSHEMRNPLNSINA